MSAANNWITSLFKPTVLSSHLMLSMCLHKHSVFSAVFSSCHHMLCHHMRLRTTCIVISNFQSRFHFVWYFVMYALYHVCFSVLSINALKSWSVVQSFDADHTWAELNLIEGRELVTQWVDYNASSVSGYLL